MNKEQCFLTLFRHLNQVSKIEQEDWRYFESHCQITHLKKGEFFKSK